MKHKLVRFMENNIAHEKEWGSYNDYPPNWQPCSDNEFWNKFMSYNCEAIENRQMNSPVEVHATMPHKHMTGAILFYYSDGIHLAMVHKIVGARYTLPLLYKFYICNHSDGWDLLESRMSYVEHRCKKCGYIETIDSSD